MGLAMRFLVLAACFAVLCVAAGAPALAQSGTVQIDARAEVAAALYAASATQAAAERAADARLRAAQAEIARLQSQGASARAELIAAQERYVADLARRDRAYAQEIAVFRTAVEDIAATPEGASALARFNAGDEIGALAVLDQLVDARERARQLRVNIETAADRRRIATLALEARARGRLDTNAVIARYAEVTRLDPGVHWDWIELARLYANAGNLVEARDAATRAAEIAEDDGDRSTALYELGAIQQAQGDLPGAQSSLQTSLRLIAGSDSPARKSDYSQLPLVVQREVASRLDRIADVLMSQSQLRGARTRIQQSVEILRRIADANPNSVEATLDVTIAAERLSDVLLAEQDYSGAQRVREENLATLRRLSAADPTSVRLQRMIAVNISTTGAAFYSQGQSAAARPYYLDGIAVFQRLVAGDPSSALLRGDLAINHFMLGNIELDQGHMAEAREHLQESLRIWNALQTEDPSHARSLVNVADALYFLARIPGSEASWTDVALRLDELRQRGLLAAHQASRLLEAQIRAQAQSGRAGMLRLRTPVRLNDYTWIQQVNALQSLRDEGVLAPHPATIRAYASMREAGAELNARTAPPNPAVAETLEAHWVWWQQTPSTLEFFLNNLSDQTVSGVVVDVSESCERRSQADPHYIVSLGTELASGDSALYRIARIPERANAGERWCMTIVGSF